VAERILRKIAGKVMVIAGMPVTMTASMGIASTETFDCGLDELMQKADTALYAAKRHGKNRVAVATADDDSGATLWAPPGGMEPVQVEPVAAEN
jgi:PleD family two-component response regulator